MHIRSVQTISVPNMIILSLTFIFIFSFSRSSFSLISCQNIFSVAVQIAGLYAIDTGFVRSCFILFSLLFTAVCIVDFLASLICDCFAWHSDDILLDFRQLKPVNSSCFTVLSTFSLHLYFSDNSVSYFKIYEYKIYYINTRNNIQFSDLINFKCNVI